MGPPRKLEYSQLQLFNRLCLRIVGSFILEIKLTFFDLIVKLCFYDLWGHTKVLYESLFPVVDVILIFCARN